LFPVSYATSSPPFVTPTVEILDCPAQESFLEPGFFLESRLVSMFP
jgi:hypothetical protein